VATAPSEFDLLAKTLLQLFLPAEEPNIRLQHVLIELYTHTCTGTCQGIRHNHLDRQSQESKGLIAQTTHVHHWTRIGQVRRALPLQSTDNSQEAGGRHATPEGSSDRRRETTDILKKIVDRPVTALVPRFALWFVVPATRCLLRAICALPILTSWMCTHTRWALVLFTSGLWLQTRKIGS
jgi:hypothetical protein